MVCVVGRMRDLILQLSKSSIYSTKPLEFVGATAQQPIINHLIREYAVEVNILFASMSEVQGRILGFMIVQLLGEPDETERAITHLVDAGVKITHV
ncbi:NIL domain-containing protein, partial [Klebsiella pneumoniae]